MYLLQKNLKKNPLKRVFENEIKILLIEQSYLIKEGFQKILKEDSSRVKLSFVNNFEELKTYLKSFEFDIVIINPSLINNWKELSMLKKTQNKTGWIGLIYAYFDNTILNFFDSLITINDSKYTILDNIKNIGKEKPETAKDENLNELSEREIDVLKLLSQGNSNKQIADKLNISTHTVISHRKNIIQKTGIKSISGLTIYAVINKIIVI